MKVGMGIFATDPVRLVVSDAKFPCFPSVINGGFQKSVVGIKWGARVVWSPGVLNQVSNSELFGISQSGTRIPDKIKLMTRNGIR